MQGDANPDDQTPDMVTVGICYQVVGDCLEIRTCLDVMDAIDRLHSKYLVKIVD